MRIRLVNLGSFSCAPFDILSSLGTQDSLQIVFELLEQLGSSYLSGLLKRSFDIITASVVLSVVTTPPGYNRTK